MEELLNLGCLSLCLNAVLLSVSLWMEYYQLWDVARRGELGINPEDDLVWMLGMVGVRFDHFSI